MKTLSGQLWLTAMCVLFGVLLMVQFRTQTRIAKAIQPESSADQAQIVANLYDANVALRNDIAALARQLTQERGDFLPDRAGEVATDIEKLRIVNGSAPARGPGVELSVAADIRPEDIQDLINELRNAGAEALALNGHRITARTAVTSDRQGVIVGGRRVASPYRFEAVGATETLERALTRKGGLVSYLQSTYPEGEIAVLKSARLTLPAAEDSPGHPPSHTTD